MLPLTTVTLMLHVPTLLGASPVHVTKDTLEMEPLVMVTSYKTVCMYGMMILWCSGPPSSPTILNTSMSTNITLTWSQSPRDVVDSYQISYSFTIRGCGVGGGNVSTVTGTSREYTLTGLEENSDFTINIIAMNGAGSSPPATIITRTLNGSLDCIPFNVHCYAVTIYFEAPSSPPKSLRISSTSSTSISITWGDVPCRERNVDMITGYSVTYICNDNCSSPFGNETVEAHSRTFTASRLIPRTNYTFEVRAFHSNKSTSLQLTGLPTEVTKTTEIPEGKIHNSIPKKYSLVINVTILQLLVSS